MIESNENDSRATALVNIDSDGSIGAMVDRGRTLPSDWYCSSEIYKLEQLHIFRRSWDYVGHASQVNAVGDFFTCEVGGVPVVITRGKDDHIHGMVNICRHRHHPVAVGAGNRKVLHCIYHSWTYKLDGSFHAAPRTRNDPGICGDELALSPVRIDTIGDMLFVNISGDAPPLGEVMAPAVQAARHRNIAVDTAKYRGGQSLTFTANWKIVWDNNFECYHCPTVHSNWYQQARLGPEYVYLTLIGPLHYEATLDQHEGQTPDYAYHVWPTMFFGSNGTFNEPNSKTAGGGAQDYMTMRFVPLGPRETRLDIAVYSLEDLSRDEVGRRLKGVIDIVEEDREVCERVQHAHDSAIGPLGTLVTTIDSEAATVMWERLVYRAVRQPDVPLYAPLPDVS